MDTLMVMSNVADQHSALERLNEALELGLKVMKLSQKNLGEEHPNSYE
jgi:hypothetical protein